MVANNSKIVHSNDSPFPIFQKRANVFLGSASSSRPGKQGSEVGRKEVKGAERPERGSHAGAECDTGVTTEGSSLI